MQRVFQRLLSGKWACALLLLAAFLAAGCAYFRPAELSDAEYQRQMQERYEIDHRILDPGVNTTVGFN